MKTSFGRRFASYIIDFILIMLLLNLISIAIPQSKNVKKLNNELTELATKYSEKKDYSEKTVKEYMDSTAPITYRIDKENFISSVIGVVIYILYYVIFQYKNNGQTLGKKIMGIRVEKETGEMSINDYIYRSFIINSLLYNMLILIFLFTTKDNTYISMVGVLGFIQFILMTVSALMIVFRKDKKALQDIITNTKIVEVA